MRYTEDRNDPFQRWCDQQELAHLYPMAVMRSFSTATFPTRAPRLGRDPEGEIRANIVLHYQQNPMFPGIKFVSNPQFTLDTLGYEGTFPFAEG